MLAGSPEAGATGHRLSPGGRLRRFLLQPRARSPASSVQERRAVKHTVLAAALAAFAPALADSNVHVNIGSPPYYGYAPAEVVYVERYVPADEVPLVFVAARHARSASVHRRRSVPGWRMGSGVLAIRRAAAHAVCACWPAAGCGLLALRPGASEALSQGLQIAQARLALTACPSAGSRFCRLRCVSVPPRSREGRKSAASRGWPG